MISSKHNRRLSSVRLKYDYIRIHKMNTSFFSKKSRFTMTLLLFLAMMGSLISDFPIELPEEDEIRYTAGVFEIQRAMKSTNHVLIKQINNSRGYQVFSCSYSPFSNGKSSSCGDTKYLKPYVNEEVTIGWYNIDKLLWFKNDMPQLVTIEINDEVVRSYDDTVLVNSSPSTLGVET